LPCSIEEIERFVPNGPLADAEIFTCREHAQTVQNRKCPSHVSNQIASCSTYGVVILDARLSTANSEIKFRQAGMCGLCFLSLIRARGRRLGSAQCSIDLRLNAPSRQGRQPRLCSAGLELVTEPKLPLPDVRLGRCDDRV